MKRRYSLHWYLDLLIYAKDCLRELTFDDLHVINVRRLSLTNYKAVDLPGDYQDWSSVSIRVGQKLRPLVEDNNITSLYNYNSNFVPQPYSNAQEPAFYQNAIFPVFWRMTNFNEFGENTGRIFGAGAGNPVDTFNVIKARNQIQLNDRTEAEEVVLSYISNGQSADAATHIDGYAQATIEAYILWQLKENSRTYGDGEKERARQLYISERKILRARLADWDINKLKRIIQKNSQQSPKT
jgi:hypothetical protein